VEHQDGDRDTREAARVRALHDHWVLDRPADPELEAVVRVAAALAGVPTATLNLIDSDRQCQLAVVGFEAQESPRADSMCAVSLGVGGFVLVPDARRDPRFAGGPWVDGRAGRTRFYAAAPLVTAEGHALGTLCVFDEVSRTLTDEQVARLTDLAGVAVALLERHRRIHHEQHLGAAAEEARLLVEMAHEELAERHELLEAVLDTVDTGIVAVDATGRGTVLNHAVRRWHGLPADLAPQEALAQAPGNLLSAQGRALLPPDSPLLRALDGRGSEDEEVLLALPGRAPLRAVARTRALRGTDGRVTGAVMSLTDVTAERAAAAELERSNTELQQFAAVASHDLRSPLTVVDGYVELAAEVYADALGERGRAWLATARGGARRMGSLIDALLGYAQAGARVLVPEPVDVQQLLDLATVDLRAAIADADAVVTAQGPLPTVWADPVQLRQLLQNLLANAVKFRRPGCPASIRCSVATEPGRWVFAVADDGTGIPPDRREQVFSMFERAGAGPRTEGHGIGLATAERIVTRHGGRIWAEETPGGGTTVRFTVPRPGRATPPVRGSDVGLHAGAL
jgi:signal transduction histidine kinase